MGQYTDYYRTYVDATGRQHRVFIDVENNVTIPEPMLHGLMLSAGLMEASPTIELDYEGGVWH